MAELQKMLWSAERPIAILGGPGWTERASAAFARFAERFDLPVAGSFRRASAFDGEHDNYAGEIGLSANPKLKARIERADLVMLVGGRMSEAAAQGYTLFDIPVAASTPRPCPRRPARDRPQLSSDAGDHRDLAGILRRARGRPSSRGDPVVGGDAPGARRLSSPGASRRRPIPAACR